MVHYAAKPRCLRAAQTERWRLAGWLGRACPERSRRVSPLRVTSECIGMTYAEARRLWASRRDASAPGGAARRQRGVSRQLHQHDQTHAHGAVGAGASQLGGAQKLRMDLVAIDWFEAAFGEIGLGC